MTDPLRAGAQSLEAFGGANGIGLRPFSDTLVVAVTDEAAPELGDLIIVQADEVTGNGAAREASEKILEASPP